MFSKAVRLFNIAGFEIRIDASWLLIAALIVWTLSTGWFPETLPGQSTDTYLTMAVLAMLGLFSCLVLHELAHSLVARRFGLGVGGITLFIFGGVAELEKEPVDANSEFWIAVAGPAASFALALIAGIGAWLLPMATPAQAIMAYLSTINLTLALFNLVPAFPLDGGRVLRSLIWRKTGDMVRATQVASTAGMLFAWVLIFMGAASMVSGQGATGLWPILIGLFLMSASRASYEQVLIKSTLARSTAASMMSTSTINASPLTTLSDLVDDAMIGHGRSFVPVTDADGLYGYIDSAAIRAVDRALWPTTRVVDAMQPSSPDNTVSPDTPAVALLELMGKTGRRKFLVARNGRLEGVVTLSDLMEYIALLQDLGVTTANGTKRHSSFVSS